VEEFVATVLGDWPYVCFPPNSFIEGWPRLDRVTQHGENYLFLIRYLFSTHGVNKKRLKSLILLAPRRGFEPTGILPRLTSWMRSVPAHRDLGRSIHL
jgi:hypothetical protein